MDYQTDRFLKIFDSQQKMLDSQEKKHDSLKKMLKGLNTLLRKHDKKFDGMKDALDDEDE